MVLKNTILELLYSLISLYDVVVYYQISEVQQYICIYSEDICDQKLTEDY